VRFSLLGPLVVVDGEGNQVVLAGPRLRVLLAALLLHANIPVPAGELAELVWDGSPPAGAAATLRSHAARLRRALGGDSARIVTQSPGYLIRAGRQELDVVEFGALCADARAALRAGQWASASAAAGRALGLWRATPLLDIPSEALRAEFGPRLERLRLQALEDRFDAGLQLGRYQELAPQLLEATARYPLQERFHAQLMLALAATGRRAQALDAYQQARRALIDELGIEPGPELHALHQQILTADAQAPPPADATSAGEAPGTADKNAATVRALDHFPHTSDHTAVPLPPAGEPATSASAEEPAPFAGAHPDTVRRLADAFELRGGTRDEFIAGVGRWPAHGAAAGAGAAAAGSRCSPGEGTHTLVPRQLPSRVRHFTGRKAELDFLACLLDAPEAPDGGGTVVISAIGGIAGAGKTALALHWAHQVAGRFPDGQLYVNLRGFDPSGIPVAPAEAVGGFLDALGVPPERIPSSPEAQAALYRSLLAGKRMLIVADNARDEAQVRPLLSASPASLVLVTSRSQLTGLAATDGARLLSLDVLSHDEAVQLLTARLGESLAVAEPGAVGEIAALCAGLPLALAVAAARAAARPRSPLTELAAELRDAAGRLDALDAGDPAASVRAVFSWSHRSLSAEAVRAFRLLGLHPGADIEPYAAAALAGTTVPQARRVLNVLVRANLISPAAPGRYGMHDLLRGYAREQAAALDTAQERHEALTRLLDYYLHTAAAAMDALLPAERGGRPRIPRPATPVPPLPHPAAARQWLDAERAALVAVAAPAARDWPAHATRLATTLARYLRSGGHLTEANSVFSHALGAARCTGDRIAEAAILNQMGMVDWQLVRLEQACDHQRQALALFHAAGDRAGEAYALGGMGLAELRLCRYDQAARHQQQAIAIFRDVGDRFGEAWTLGFLGLARREQSRYQEASRYFRQSLELSREIGDQEGEAWSLARLGVIDQRQDRYGHAARYFQQALALLEEIGSTVGVTEIAGRLGEAYLGLGRYQEATANFEQALAGSRQIGDRVLQADALNGLGEVLLRAGDADQARARYSAALRLAAETDMPDEVQGRTHCGLARACQADGDLAQAKYHRNEAITCYAAIGVPEANEIRAHLAIAGNDDQQPAALE
jgi:DNA-binding SARP family transcriptional activator/Tfp pilus assembly protein PilF